MLVCGFVYMVNVGMWVYSSILVCGYVGTCSIWFYVGVWVCIYGKCWHVGI